MNDMNYEIARFNMIQQQIRPWNILDSASLDQLQRIPREEFVPQKFKQMAFSDIEIPIAHNQFMLSPKIEAHILQAVQIKKSDRILEIGTGSGFFTAVLANLGSQVTSIDIEEDFIDQAYEKLKEYDIKNVTFECRDASKNLHTNYTFDVIIISAGLSELPDFYKELLNVNGRLFVVSGEAHVMSARLITKINDHQFSDIVLFETELAMMINGSAIETFAF